MAHAFGMSVAAWSPLAGGILSGKFTRQGGPASGTRVSMDALTQHDHTVARVVDEIASDMGASASQVAIAWTRARSNAVHPIIRARRLDQLLDNLAAVECTLPPEALRRLDDASDFVAGFPPTSSTTQARGCSVKRLRGSTHADSSGALNKLDAGWSVVPPWSSSKQAPCWATATLWTRASERPGRAT